MSFYKGSHNVPNLSFPPYICLAEDIPKVLLQSQKVIFQRVMDVILPQWENV
jgi:hypothetical protein